MNIRMVVCDLDGTLLDSDGKLDQETKECIWQIQQKGIIFVLASGRNDYALVDLERELHMDEFPQNYVIGLNGQMILRLQDHSVSYDVLLHNEDCALLLDLASKYNLEAICFAQDGAYNYIPPRYWLYKQVYQAITGKRFVQDIESRIAMRRITKNGAHFEKDVYKVVYIQSIKKLDTVLPRIKATVGDRYQALRVKPKWVEVMPAHVSKGNAVVDIARQNGIRLDEILVFGDGENDLSMIRAVKYGISMGNALDEVKSAAYEICDTNDNRGVLKTIRKYMAYVAL